jgi:hypothetical protein
MRREILPPCGTKQHIENLTPSFPPRSLPWDTQKALGNGRDSAAPFICG